MSRRRKRPIVYTEKLWQVVKTLLHFKPELAQLQPPLELYALTQWHWQIKRGETVLYNLWPTVLKQLPIYTAGPAIESKYTDEFLAVLARWLKNYAGLSQTEPVLVSAPASAPEISPASYMPEDEFTAAAPAPKRKLKVMPSRDAGTMLLSISTASYCENFRLSVENTQEFIDEIYKLFPVQKQAEVTYDQTTSIELAKTEETLASKYAAP